MNGEVEKIWTNFFDKILIFFHLFRRLPILSCIDTNFENIRHLDGNLPKLFDPQSRSVQLPVSKLFETM